MAALVSGELQAGKIWQHIFSAISQGQAVEVFKFVGFEDKAWQAIITHYLEITLIIELENLAVIAEGHMHLDDVVWQIRKAARWSGWIKLETLI